MRRALALAVVALSVLAGCTNAVPGRAHPIGATPLDDAGAAPAAGPPAIPEEPAVWAVAALDPCALLRGAPVSGPGEPYLTRPHNCGLDYTHSDGDTDRLVVRVGTSFETTDRAAMLPIEVGGRIAYWAQDTEESSVQSPSCQVDIPISATRSIQVLARSSGGPLEQSCAATGEAAGAVAAALDDPAALAGIASPLFAGRSACDLLDGALDLTVLRTGLNAPTADECSAADVAEGQFPSGAETEVEMTTGTEPDEPLEPFGDEEIVTLPLGPALKVPYGTFCRLRFVAERQPGAPAEAATQTVELTARNSPDPCATVVDAGTKVQQVLQTPAPTPPPAPERLGFAPGTPDDVMPVACGAFGNTDPTTCRAPRPAQPPTGAAALIDSLGGPDSADASCEILRAVADGVLDDLELAAAEPASCIGLTGDGYVIDLGLHADDPASDYCVPFGAPYEEVRIAGRPGIRCYPGPSTYNLTLPALGPDPGVPGVLLVDASLRPPRGDITLALEPGDEARISELTTRIATAVVERYLS
ncbi:hypothetical protein [Pseudonocardia lacus]|uniref:hypothetical protein n=1 Tax=Pseudonocardia lacus TaxID=2835865 RepID=UPI001BDCEEB3|nr:hypothetical protein [Pseudonocardia lacus]